MNREFYVIMTQFGFVSILEEDYTFIKESNPLSKLYNVSFTDDPSFAKKFHSKYESAPKYAFSKYNHKDINLEKWVEEINAKLVRCKTTSEEKVSFRFGTYRKEKVETFQVLSKNDFNEFTKFKEFPYKKLKVEHFE